MSNTIQIKRKTTTGAPSLGQLAVGEFCLVIPDNTLYIKKDTGTIIGPFNVGSGAAVWGGITGTLADQTDLNSALAAKAPLASPTFTGVPSAPTAAGGTNTTQVATTAFVQAAIASLVAAAPGALDTLNELATALGNDANFASTVTSALAAKLDANSTIDGGTIS